MPVAGSDVCCYVLLSFTHQSATKEPVNPFLIVGAVFAQYRLDRRLLF